MITRQDLVEKTKNLIKTDYCLRFCETTGKKPFINSTVEEGCHLFAFHQVCRLMADTSFLPKNIRRF